MRVIAAVFVVVLVTIARAAPTVWNVKLGQTRVTFIDGNPNDVLPACRCVAGTWRLGGETSTHFAGTLELASSNHVRKPVERINAKIRKTRALLGVQQEYRPTLHGIMRGTGHLLLREVAGNQWEVVAFAPAPLGDLFARQPSWRADDEDPAPAKPSPLIDPKADAAALAKLINAYRATLKLPAVPISPALAKVARAHVHDLNVNKPTSDRCNMHSWSSKGRWTGCCYDGSTAAARCMWTKPKEIAGYAGNGYEIAAMSSGITPEQALELWQKSSAHHVVMINQDKWKDPWRAMGVAVEGDYAVAWFGEEPDRPAKKPVKRGRR